MARYPAALGVFDEGKRAKRYFPTPIQGLRAVFWPLTRIFALAAIGEGASLAQRFAGPSLNEVNQIHDDAHQDPSFARVVRQPA